MRATKLLGADNVIQLLKCCDEQQRMDLTRNTSGALTEKSEDDVLTAMRILAVREKNGMIARVRLYNIETRQRRANPCLRG